MSNNTDLFTGAAVIAMYTAEDAVADGVLLHFNPMTAREAGYLVPVLLTRAAYENVIEWTGDAGLQSEDARFWDVLIVSRSAAKRALQEGMPQSTHVWRILNKTSSGKQSSACSPSKAELQVSVEGFNAAGAPCVIIALPGED